MAGFFLDVTANLPRSQRVSQRETEMVRKSLQVNGVRNVNRWGKGKIHHYDYLCKLIIIIIDPITKMQKRFVFWFDLKFKLKWDESIAVGILTVAR